MTIRLDRRKFMQLSAASAVAAKLGMGEARGNAGESAIDAIDPLIGASTSTALGEGKTFPGATTPFGMVQLSPDTITGGDNASGYSFEHTTIEGFSFTHMSGVGWYGDFGNLMTMPTTGGLKVVSGRTAHPGEGWRSRFDHKSETAKCGYYAVTLDDYGIRAELTAAARSGMMRFTFPRAEEARIQIDLARRIGGTSTRQYVKIVAPQAIEGWVRCTPQGGGWGNGDGHVGYTLHFRMEFSRPITKYGTWSIDVPESMLAHDAGLIADHLQSDAYYSLAAKAKIARGVKETEGDHIGFFTEFVTKDKEQVLVKAGISFVDIEGARKNLRADIAGWDFDGVVSGARGQWASALDAIHIDGATETQKRIFATAMYHAMIDPRAVADADGRYVAGDGKTGAKGGFTPRTIFSGWDVFRAELPLMTLIHPKLVNDQICSLLDLAEKSGKGYLERWEIMNAYSGCMDGDPAIAVILDAYSKGIRGFDAERAYAACRQSAAGIGAATGRPENDFYQASGFVPDQVSWTMDNAYFDWCVGRLAKAMGKDKDAKLFLARAANYRKIFDPQVGMMRARHRNGEWMEWNGKLEFGQGCTESNPLQQLWFVPQDMYGLMALMGKDRFAEALEEMFEKTPDSFGWNPYYNHSNEPVHHVPYLFVYAGKPWLTQKWVRRILEQAYHARVNGICGNDDVGQMSAWYVMSALGFYPVCPGSGVYILGAPLFREAVIRLQPQWHGGSAFRIVAAKNGPENCYVQAIRLNGKPLSRCWIRHEEVTAGGTLEFVMGPEPNRLLGTDEADLPPDTMIT